MIDISVKIFNSLSTAKLSFSTLFRTNGISPTLLEHIKNSMARGDCDIFNIPN